MWSRLLCVFTALWAAQLTFASRTSVALSEAKSQKAENGTLVYSTLSNSEVIRLFRKYEKDCKRQVMDSGNMTSDERHKHRSPLISYPTLTHS